MEIDLSNLQPGALRIYTAFEHANKVTVLYYSTRTVRCTGTVHTV